MDEPLPSHPETQTPRGAGPVLHGGPVGPPQSAFGPPVGVRAEGSAGAAGVGSDTSDGASGESVFPSGGFTQEPPTEPASDAAAHQISGESAGQHVGSLVETGTPLPVPSSKGIDGATVVSIAVVVAGLVAVAWMRGRTGVRGNGIPSGRTGVSGGPGTPAPAAEPGAAQSDLEQTALALAALVREADVRIAELTRLRDELGTPGQDQERDAHAAFVPGFDESGRDGITAQGTRRSANETHFSRPTPQRRAMQEPHAPSCADPMANRVYELADSGLSSVEIASALHEHTGKIELILALRRASVGG